MRYIGLNREEWTTERDHECLTCLTRGDTGGYLLLSNYGQMAFPGRIEKRLFMPVHENLDGTKDPVLDWQVALDLTTWQFCICNRFKDRYEIVCPNVMNGIVLPVDYRHRINELLGCKRPCNLRLLPYTLNLWIDREVGYDGLAFEVSLTFWESNIRIWDSYYQECSNVMESVPLRFK